MQLHNLGIPAALIPVATSVAPSFFSKIFGGGGSGPKAEGSGHDFTFSRKVYRTQNAPRWFKDSEVTQFRNQYNAAGGTALGYDLAEFVRRKIGISSAAQPPGAPSIPGSPGAYIAQSQQRLLAQQNTLVPSNLSVPIMIGGLAVLGLGAFLIMRR